MLSSEVNWEETNIATYPVSVFTHLQSVALEVLLQVEHTLCVHLHFEHCWCQMVLKITPNYKKNLGVYNFKQKIRLFREGEGLSGAMGH